MPFKPGNNINPNGFPTPMRRKVKQLRDLLLDDVPAAVETLRRLMKSDKQAHFAAKEILDRVYGKAPQSIELTGDQSIIVNVVLQQKK